MCTCCTQMYVCSVSTATSLHPSNASASNGTSTTTNIHHTILHYIIVLKL